MSEQVSAEQKHDAEVQALIEEQKELSRREKEVFNSRVKNSQTIQDFQQQILSLSDRISELETKAS